MTTPRAQVLTFPVRTWASLERRLITLLSSGPLSMTEAAAALRVSGSDAASVREGLESLVRKGVVSARLHSDDVVRYAYRPCRSPHRRNGDADLVSLRGRRRPRRASRLKLVT